jgi:hypothetical protein
LSHPRRITDSFRFTFSGLCDTERSLNQAFGAPCLAAR